MNPIVRKYMSAIGQRGGRISKRALAPDTARDMVKVREARRAYRRFYTECFWSYAPDLLITSADIPWVAEQLKKCSGREAWEAGHKLCR